MSLLKFPEQVHRAGVMHTQPHDAWVAFARTVYTVFCLVTAAGLALIPLSRGLASIELVVGLAASLGILTLLRFALPGTLAEGLASPIFGAAAAFFMGALAARHLPPPVWQGGAAAALLALAYVWLCGRNLSFLGLAFAGAAVLAAGAVAAMLIRAATAAQAGLFWAAGTLVVCYISYDLAMVLRRRRRAETAAAAADLYRDLLNFLTYPFRIARHWRRYRFDPLPGGRP